MNYIRWGKAEVIVTGGSEAAVNEAGIGGFGAMKALSTRNDDPATASRPFDVDRDGFVMGEGAAASISTASSPLISPCTIRCATGSVFAIAGGSFSQPCSHPVPRRLTTPIRSGPAERPFPRV